MTVAHLTIRQMVPTMRPTINMIKKVFPVLALAIFSSMLGVGIIVPLLPIYARDLGATGTQLGLLVASFFIARTIFMPFMARLSDRTGRKLFISIGLLIYAVSSLGYIFAGNVLHLIIVRSIQGFAGSMIVPIAMAYVGDLAPEGEEGKWMGYTTAAFFSGFGIGPILGGILSEAFGMDLPFYLMGGLSLLAFLVTVPLLPNIKPDITETKKGIPIKAVAKNRTVGGVLMYRFTMSLGIGVFIGFLPVYASENVSLSSTLIGILVGTSTFLMSFLAAPFGRMVDKINKRMVIILGNLVYLSSLASIPLASNFLILLIVCIFRGVGGAISLPPATALMVREGRKFGMGSAMALLTMAMNIGMSLGPIIGGIITDTLNVGSVFYIVAIAVLVGTGFFAWLTK